MKNILILEKTPNLTFVILFFAGAASSDPDPADHH